LDVFILSRSSRLEQGLLEEVSYNFLDFHFPDIASLPAGLFSTPTELSWRHACIAPLSADLFSIPAGLQTLPTTLIDIFFYFFSLLQMAERGDAEKSDIFSYFQTSSIFF
jgi:hypothetical protein